MWKKLFVICFMMITTVSIVCALHDNNLSAASHTYMAGGSVTGKVVMSPSNMVVADAHFSKGDKILMDTENPSNGNPISWLLIDESTYTDYNCSSVTAPCSNASGITAWRSFTTESMGNMGSGLTAADFTAANGAVTGYISATDNRTMARFSNYRTVVPVLDKINADIKGSNDDTILTYRNLTTIHQMVSTKIGSQYFYIGGVFDRLSDYTNNVFIPNAYEVATEGTTYPYIPPFTVTGKDLSFYVPCMTSFAATANASGGYQKVMFSIGTDGMRSVGANNSYNTSLDVRLQAYLDLTKAVFAVSPGTTYDRATPVAPNLPSGYSALYRDAVGNPMKVRVEKQALTDSTVLYQIENNENDPITKAAKDSTVLLNATAASGGDTYGGVYTVSALIFDNQGKFLYYQPLEPAKGTDTYELDLIGIPIGKYKIGIVNEAYNENSTAPADCSAITEIHSLEIVEPHKLTYTKTPQSGATAGDYEFSKNVNAGQAVGKVTANPTGVTPLTYTLETNGDNSYLNFEIDGLNSSNASSVTPLNVKIKSGAPDLVNGGLKAGTYKFCITAVDANGDPVDTSGNPTEKVCTSFTVEKTNLTVAFDDSNQTKKSIADAATVWNETATATPSTGTKITYSITGGDVSLITINPDTGAITYTGSNAFGKVKIRATVDDDPTTGNDNYNSAFVEKEIVIYREVDGSVRPHANSSDTTIPTFTASDSNVRTGGIIGTIHGTLGTPDTIGGSTTTYHYGLKPGVGNASFFSVDPNTGVIKTTANLGVNSYHITVTVSDNWSTKEIPVTINVGVATAENLKFYENSTSNTVITSKSACLTDTGVTVYATVKGSSNTNPVKYSIQDGSTNVIEVNPNSGAVTIHGVGTVIIVAEKQGAAGQADAITYLTFTVTAGTQNFIYTDSAGNELPKTSNKYNAISEVYAPNKTIQLYTAGNPTGSTVTYRLKAGSPTDVISVDSTTGEVTVLNASISPSQIDKVIVEATSHDPTGNYSDKTIEIAINITKANQTISFAGITYATSGNGTVTPVINEQDISSNAGGVTVNDTDYFITIDNSISTSIAWTNDGVNIDYSYSGDNGLDIPLHVEKPGNRNYNKAEADGMMHIMGPNENTLALNRPGKIIYGDHFTIRSLQDDSSSINVNYTFEVDNTTYISNATVTGNKAEFDALKYSGSTNIQIKVTRTADGEVPLSKTISVQVLPKPIEIIIDDKEKYKGEVNPTLTYQDFRSQLVSWNGVQDVIEENDIKLSTTAKTNSNAGSYPIKGDSNLLNTAYPNYTFTFKEGTLKVKEENIQDNWYHLEIDDGSHTLYTGGWTNKDVNIISDHNEYINMSLDQSTWKPNQVTVTKEGETNQSFWMKKDSGAITKEKQEIIKIDKTAPKVKSIKAKDTNNKLQDIINKLSGGIFFKPGTAFEITTDDSKDNLKVSGTKEISYKVYKLTEGNEEPIKDGTLTVTKEKSSITISETTGTYKVCVIPTDNAGNTNTESCHEVELKKIDVDVDGDGKPDFNDPDGDGCPDLNIKWKDPNDESKWIVINGDRNNDGIPDLNIDSDGDGKPDLNIDTDKDGKPDLNLVILKKSDWKPTKCVQIDIDKGILEEYCTGTSVKAKINVDTDGDGIPNINIDNKGDFKPHINIAKDGKNPSVNIVEIHEWNPKKDYKSGKFSYDSIGKNDIKPEINIDTDGDGLPDINIDLDDDGEADINIDVDGDGIPDIDIDSDGDGIPDVNVDNDGDGKPDENIIEITEWKPGKNVDGDFPYDTMDFSEPDESNDENETSVKGQYNPETSMGGANTGDNTNIMIYMGISLLSVSLLLYLSHKYKTE